MFKITDIQNLLNNKTLIRYIIIIFILFVLNIILNNIKNTNEIELTEISEKYNLIKKLNSDEFILKHSFKENKNNTNNFIEYVKKYLKSNHGEIIEIKNTDSKKIDNIKVETINFNLTFPHDKFIFELLELIQKYHPGFVRIVDIYIKKDENFDIMKNNLTVRIICNLYNK